MAWANITAYTAGEKAKVKADIDEAIALIDAKVTWINNMNGKLTDEEQYLLQYKALLVARSATLV